MNKEDTAKLENIKAITRRLKGMHPGDDCPGGLPMYVPGYTVREARSYCNSLRRRINEKYGIVTKITPGACKRHTQRHALKRKIERLVDKKFPQLDKAYHVIFTAEFERHRKTADKYRRDLSNALVATNFCTVSDARAYRKQANLYKKSLQYKLGW